MKLLLHGLLYCVICASIQIISMEQCTELPVEYCEFDIPIVRDHLISSLLQMTDTIKISIIRFANGSFGRSARSSAILTLKKIECVQKNLSDARISYALFDVSKNNVSLAYAQYYMEVALQNIVQAKYSAENAMIAAEQFDIVIQKN